VTPSKCKSRSRLNSRRARVQAPASTTKRSNTGSNTGTITRRSKRASSDGKTPRAAKGKTAGGKGTSPTRGRLSAVGSNTHQLMLSRPDQAWEVRRIGVIRTVGGPHDVFLDFDLGAVVPRLHPIWRLCRLVGLRPVWIESFRTRKGWHVWIRLRERLTPAERVAFQACAGSDPRREELNLMRVVAIRRNDPGPYWRERWNLLFERKLT